MDIVKGKLAKNLMIKAWKRCSLTNQSSSKRKKSKDRVLAPDGCFSVYVGPEKQRFVVKVEFANHPLFKVLLEYAAWDYGYSSGGPIMLPCDVELFYNVLAAMENNVDDDMMSTPNDFFFKPCSSPTRHLRLNSSKFKGYGGAYVLLSPSLA
ncbi:auxin-responsive protein SAUR71-like [Rosa rugosa]|uniref:auxin-responsive protein SAUR71-like n=1 Tax=Rosa rugosa TaxID=74645 RepID=UPI002B40BEA9|nr:auxin-responsive protein SAUR71-like [Rosa rugosa]